VRHPGAKTAWSRRCRAGPGRSRCRRCRRGSGRAASPHGETAAANSSRRPVVVWTAVARPTVHTGQHRDDDHVGLLVEAHRRGGGAGPGGGPDDVPDRRGAPHSVAQRPDSDATTRSPAKFAAIAGRRCWAGAGGLGEPVRPPQRRERDQLRSQPYRLGEVAERDDLAGGSWRAGCDGSDPSRLRASALGEPGKAW